ncbi:Dephospho-CoA kinase [compost metagenome]
MARNGFSREQVQAIMARQATRRARLACADDVIDNDGPVDALVTQVGRLDRYYRELSASGKVHPEAGA